MRTHTYTCAKGYAEQYKNREVKWQVPETVAESVASGEFPDEKTLVRYATAQLNIKKGHAIQDATQELAKDAEGKAIAGKLARPNLTLADMEKIAADTKATATERSAKGTGGQKAQAKQFQTIQDKARKMAETATPEKLAMLLELGSIDQATHDARLAAIKSTEPAKPASVPKTAPRGK